MRAYIHGDEITNHAHIRLILDYTDADGYKKICTDKALKALGIKPPKEKEKTTRYNNALQTFTEQLRFIWNAIIRRNGIEIDDTVTNPSQKHLTVLEYKDKKLTEEIDNKNMRIIDKNAEIKQKQQEIYLLDKQINAQKQKLEELEREIYINQYREDFNDLRPVFENERYHIK